MASQLEPGALLVPVRLVPERLVGAHRDMRCEGLMRGHVDTSPTGTSEVGRAGGHWSDQCRRPEVQAHDVKEL